MSTTGVADFTLDLSELCEEAFERCGKQLRSGYDFRTARRSLNLLLIEWANKGINLWTVEQQQIVLNTGQAVYPLPLDTVDILDMVVRRNNGTSNQSDVNLARISEPTYATLPNKNTTGYPIQAYIARATGVAQSSSIYTLDGAITATTADIMLNTGRELPSQGFVEIGGELVGYQNIIGRQIINAWRGQRSDAAPHASGTKVVPARVPCIYLWPTPSAPGDQYTLVYYRMRRMHDAGSGISTADVPYRFLPALAAGLAYQLSNKLEGVDPQRVGFLKQVYEQLFQEAADEDRERAPLRLVPRSGYWWR